MKRHGPKSHVSKWWNVESLNSEQTMIWTYSWSIQMMRYERLNSNWREHCDGSTSMMKQECRRWSRFSSSERHVISSGERELHLSPGRTTSHAWKLHLQRSCHLGAASENASSFSRLSWACRMGTAWRSTVGWSLLWPGTGGISSKWRGRRARLCTNCWGGPPPSLGLSNLIDRLDTCKSNVMSEHFVFRTTWQSDGFWFRVVFAVLDCWSWLTGLHSGALPLSKSMSCVVLQPACLNLFENDFLKLFRQSRLVTREMSSWRVFWSNLIGRAINLITIGVATWISSGGRNLMSFSRRDWMSFWRRDLHLFLTSPFLNSRLSRVCLLCDASEWRSIEHEQLVSTFL